MTMMPIRELKKLLISFLKSAYIPLVIKLAKIQIFPYSRIIFVALRFNRFSHADPKGNR